MYPRSLPCLGNNQLQQRPANNTLFPSRLCKEPSISSPWSSLSYWTSSSSRSPSSPSPPSSSSSSSYWTSSSSSPSPPSSPSSSSYWTSASSRSGGGVWHVQSTDGVRVWHCRGGQSLLFRLFSTTFFSPYFCHTLLFLLFPPTFHFFILLSTFWQKTVCLFSRHETFHMIIKLKINAPSFPQLDRRWKEFVFKEL